MDKIKMELKINIENINYPQKKKLQIDLEQLEDLQKSAAQTIQKVYMDIHMDPDGKEFPVVERLEELWTDDILEIIQWWISVRQPSGLQSPVEATCSYPKVCTICKGTLHSLAFRHQTTEMAALVLARMAVYETNIYSMRNWCHKWL